jgi:hypothetical protein
MKTVLKAIGIVVVAAVVVVGSIILGARWLFGPLGPIPGPGLTGPVVQEPVQDWSFIDAVAVVQLESRPEAPYSNNIWVTRVGDGIYIFAAGEETAWVGYIGRDSDVRLGVEDRIYERRAVKVEKLEAKRLFLTRMRAKYEGELGFDLEFWQRAWDTGEFVLFRLEPR